MRTLVAVIVTMVILPVTAWAQEAPPPPDAPCPCAGNDGARGPMGMGPGGMGAFWKNPEVAKQLGLSDDQAKTIQAAFQEHRRKLVDLRAAVERAEIAVQESMEADKVDASKSLGLADAVIAARGQLQREFSLMILKVRTTLTRDQWQKLHEMRPRHEMRGRGMGRGFGGGFDRGPDDGPGEPPAKD